MMLRRYHEPPAEAEEAPTEEPATEAGAEEAPKTGKRTRK